jgi:hypothetical protein
VLAFQSTLEALDRGKLTLKKGHSDTSRCRITQL